MKCCVNKYALVLLLICSTSAYAQGPVAFDDSKAREMRTVWIMKSNATGFAAYMQDVADIPGKNIATVFVNGEYRTWPTTPLLDTTANAVQWIDAQPYQFTALFDYDGQPPMEYFSSNGVFRPSLDGSVMTGIDTISCLTAQASTPEYTRTDVDGDGTMDIVAKRSGDIWFKALLAGEGHGRGCDRVVTFPNHFMDAIGSSWSREPMRMMRCADGKVRIVWTGTFLNEANSYRTGIYLLDVLVQQTGQDYVVSYTIADSITQRFLVFPDLESPWVVDPLVCVDDSKNGHQYALVSWQDGYHVNHNTTVMYEVSNGKLVERISTVGFLPNATMKTFDNTFDDGEAVVLYGRSFARISEFHRPFAKLASTVFASTMAFIDDQFNDGTRDLLAGTDNSITLVNFDLNPTDVAASDSSNMSWAQLESGLLRLTLERPSTISVEVVNSIGQKKILLSAFNIVAGPTTLDISQQLSALPKGAWFIRVSDGVRSVTLSYLR